MILICVSIGFVGLSFPIVNYNLLSVLLIKCESPANAILKKRHQVGRVVWLTVVVNRLIKLL
jgi:hypothetical protein